VPSAADLLQLPGRSLGLCSSDPLHHLSLGAGLLRWCLSLHLGLAKLHHVSIGAHHFEVGSGGAALPADGLHGGLAHALAGRLTG